MRKRTQEDWPEPLLVSIAVAERLLGVGRSSIWEMIAAGELEAIKVYNRTLIKARSVHNLAERGTSGAKAPRPGGRAA